MDPFDAALAASSVAFTQSLGETVTYKKKDGSTRVIMGIVNRQPAVRLGSDGFAYTPKMEIDVRNDQVAGIAAPELDAGGDVIVVAYRHGDVPEDHRISGEPVGQDGGMIRLNLR